MLLNPAVLALVILSAVLVGIAAAAATTSIAVLARWHPDEDGERQLAREHRLLLVEMTLKIDFALQLVSIFAFIWVADRLHSLLPGAMCAAGSLAANRFGYPELMVKLAAFLVVGLWWLLHRESPGAVSLALVRFKHLALIAVTLILLADNTLQIRYFANLRPDVLTSCCSSIFSENLEGLGSRLAGVPPRGSQIAFFSLLGATAVVGARIRGRQSRPALYAILAAATGVAGIVSVISWVAPAFYEAPTHHCPFCLLQGEAHYVGYLLYPALFVGSLSGLGAGVVRALRPLDPLGALRPRAEVRLCGFSLTGFLFFTLIAVWPLLTSDLRIESL